MEFVELYSSLLYINCVLQLVLFFFQNELSPPPFAEGIDAKQATKQTPPLKKGERKEAGIFCGSALVAFHFFIFFRHKGKGLFSRFQEKNVTKMSQFTSVRFLLGKAFDGKTPMERAVF